MAMKDASGAREIGTLESVVGEPGEGVRTISETVVTAPGERVWPPGRRMPAPALGGRGEKPGGRFAGGMGAGVGEPGLGLGLGLGGMFSFPAVGSGFGWGEGGGAGGRKGLRIWLIIGGTGFTADWGFPPGGGGGGGVLSPVPGL